MAEGGYDPDETGTFDPNEGADDRTPLIPHHRTPSLIPHHRTPPHQMEMKDRTSTPLFHYHRTPPHHQMEMKDRTSTSTS